jgi:uncharacterized iron-regulated membrane protein
VIRLPRREATLMVAVHGWSGVVLGLLLYAVIVTGTAAVFSQEIKSWSAGALGPQEPFARPLDVAVRRRAAETPAVYLDEISLGGTVAGNVWLFFHTHDTPPGGGEVKERGILYEVAPDGHVVARNEGWGDDLFAADPRTALGQFFVDLHVRLHLPKPWGLVLTGILALAMLVAAVSGLLMHRRLFLDIFTLRRGRDRLVALRDAHTVAATWTLPHAFVLAFTGAFFSFALSVGLPILAKTVFNGNQAALFRALIGSTAAPNPRPAEPSQLDHVLSDARSRTGTPIVFTTIDHWGRADARITVRHAAPDGSLADVRLVYDGVSGAFLAEKPALGVRPSIGGMAFGAIRPLHVGSFAGWWSKIVWAALGATTAYVAFSGLRLWVRRRIERSGSRALGRMTAWVGGGLPLAMATSAAAFFAALPSGATVQRTPVGFLIAAALSLVAAIVLPAAYVCRLLFSATGLVLLSLPWLRLATGGPTWSQALQAAQSAIPALDTLVTLAGVTCLIPAAVALRRRLTQSRSQALTQAAE